MAELQLSLTDVVLRRELIAEGFTDRDIRAQVKSGALTRLRYGAYAPTELVHGVDGVNMMRARARAVLRTAHGSAVLSHQNGLAEHGVPLWGVGLAETHLTRTDGRAGRREAGLVATCGVLHRELATLAELHEAAATARHWPGSLGTRLVLARADGRLTNVAEARTWHLFFEQRIPRPEPQVHVHDETGNLLGIVDFLWPGLGVFLEFDGRIKYEQHRRPGESLADYLMREKRREEQICVHKGWICIRVTWADLERPVVLARRIMKALNSRSPKP